MPRTISAARRKPSEREFPSQSKLDFDLTLLERYSSFLAVVQAAVHVTADKQESVAAACDYSPTEFNRRLADNVETDPGHPYPLRRFEVLMDALDPHAQQMVLDWLDQKYRCRPEEAIAQAAATIGKLAPILARAAAVLEGR